MSSARSKKMLALAITASILLNSACMRQNEAVDNKGPKPQPVEIITLQEKPLRQWLDLTGSVVATTAVQISATTEGPIAFCPWREGDQVKKNDRLLEIDRPVYRREVDAAEAAWAVAQSRLEDLQAGARSEEIAQAAEMVRQLEENTLFVQSDLERIETMVASGSLPGEEQEKARVAYVKSSADLRSAKERLLMLQRGPTPTAVAVHKALVKEAQARLERARAVAAECVIIAPFDGVITRVHVRPGDLAIAKAPLLEIMAPDSLAVRFSIPEKYTQQILPSTAVKLRFDAIAGEEYESQVTMVYPELETRTRTRPAEAAIPAGIKAAPGMFTRLRVVTRSLPAALSVPDNALLTLADGRDVVFVYADGVAQRRQVSIILENDGLVALSSGVSAGEKIIVRGHELLQDGSKVQPPGKDTKAGRPSAETGTTPAGEGK